MHIFFVESESQVHPNWNIMNIDKKLQQTMEIALWFYVFFLVYYYCDMQLMCKLRYGLKGNESLVEQARVTSSVGGKSGEGKD